MRNTRFCRFASRSMTRTNTEVSGVLGFAGEYRAETEARRRDHALERRADRPGGRAQASREGGSNPEARRARGLEALTCAGSALAPAGRGLGTLTYSGRQESRSSWQGVDTDARDTPAGEATQASLQNRAAIGIDIKTELLRRIRKTLFNAGALRVEADGQTAAIAQRRPRADVSVMPDVYPRSGERCTTPSGDLWLYPACHVRTARRRREGAVDEFVRIFASYRRPADSRRPRQRRRLHQLRRAHPSDVEPRRLRPSRFIHHDGVHVEAHRVGRLAEGVGGTAGHGVATGAAFSQGIPLTNPPDLQQHRPCSRALSSSSPTLLLQHDDIFAGRISGSRDRHHSRCHSNTGAGGANVWDHAELLQELT